MKTKESGIEIELDDQSLPDIPLNYAEPNCKGEYHIDMRYISFKKTEDMLEFTKQCSFNGEVILTGLRFCGEQLGRIKDLVKREYGDKALYHINSADFRLIECHVAIQYSMGIIKEDEIVKEAEKFIKHNASTCNCSPEPCAVNLVVEFVKDAQKTGPMASIALELAQKELKIACDIIDKQSSCRKLLDIVDKVITTIILGILVNLKIVKKEEVEFLFTEKAHRAD